MKSNHARHRPSMAELEQSGQSVLWWPSALALLAVGLAYSVVSDRLTVAPPSLVLSLAVGAAMLTSLLTWRRKLLARRIIALLMLVLSTAAVAVSALFLLISPTVADLSPVQLLADAALLWVANILNFALWYWELDGGGPAHRLLPGAAPSSDFAFPPQQQAAVSGAKDLDWSPLLVDYLFLAFTSSSTFGPTDTLVMARRAKLLMMVQAGLSLIIFGGVVARAVGNLH